MTLKIIEDWGSEFYLEDYPLKSLVGDGKKCTVTLKNYIIYTFIYLFLI